MAGNHKECPSINTLAERANVHRNTVMNWLPKLQEAGELTVEKHGNGRGAHLVYTILLPIDPVNLPEGKRNDTSPQTGDVPIEQNETDLLVQEMAGMKQLLVQQNELLVQALVQGIGTNGTSPQTGVVHDPFDPSLDPKGEESPPPPFSAEWFEQNSIPSPEGEEERALLEHPATAVWLEIIGRWPTYPGLRQITKRLGINPDHETLRDVWDIWRASNYNLSNIAGVLDRYEKALSSNSPASPAPSEQTEAMTIPHTGKGW